MVTLSRASAAVILAGLASLAVVCSAPGCTTPPHDPPTSSVSSALVDGGGGGAAVRGTIVISQVYGGGGSPNATFDSDFVELLNRSKAPISLAGLSLQIASADADFGSKPSDILALSGTVGPGEYVLIALSSGNPGDGIPLPTADFSGPLGLGDSAGKVALALSTAPLACGGFVTAKCAAAKVLDVVGYGLVSDFEGALSGLPLDPQKSATRKEKGCTDANDNRADFTVGPPAPRNAATAKADCPTTPVVTPPGPKDAGPTPPVVDPPLGPEVDYDAGATRDAGKLAASGATEDCSVVAVGKSQASAFELLLVAGVIVAARRRRRGRASA